MAYPEGAWLLKLGFPERLSHDEDAMRVPELSWDTIPGPGHRTVTQDLRKLLISVPVAWVISNVEVGPPRPEPYDTTEEGDYMRITFETY